MMIEAKHSWRQFLLGLQKEARFLEAASAVANMIYRTCMTLFVARLICVEVVE